MYYLPCISKHDTASGFAVLSCFSLYCIGRTLQIRKIGISQCSTEASGSRKAYGFNFVLFKVVPQYKTSLGIGVLKSKQIGQTACNALVLSCCTLFFFFLIVKDSLSDLFVITSSHFPE